MSILIKTNPSKDSKASEGREEAVFVGEKYDLAKVENISCYEQSNAEIFFSTRELRGSRLTQEECSKL